MRAVLSPFIALVVAFVAAPLIAWGTKGKYYLARPANGLPEKATELECSICENVFERGDIAMCPAYSGPICSLCCTLEARCRDQCKTNSRFNEQLDGFISHVLPQARRRDCSIRAPDTSADCCCCRISPSACC